MSTPIPAAPAQAPSAPHPDGSVRGHLLRQSLKFTLLAWIPGAFWQGATSSTAMTPFGQYLGANDFIFALITAAPNIGVLFMIPGVLAVEKLGRRKPFFIWAVTPHRALYILIGLLPWLLPSALSTAGLLAFLIFICIGRN